MAPQAQAALLEAEPARQASASVRKALQLLDVFAGSGEALNLSGLARRVDLPKSTTFRLLGQLVESGFVTRVGNKYHLSIHAFELGNHALAQNTTLLREIAAPYLGSLFQQATFTVNLAVLDGADVLWIDKIQGLRAPRTPSRVGGRMPATITGLGKAMLAFSPREVVRAAIGEPGLIRTARGPVAPGLFLNQLKTVRRTAIAYDHEEAARGITCIAAPVLVRGEPLAAVSVSGPTGRFQPESLAPLVLRTADRIAHDLTDLHANGGVPRVGTSAFV